MTRSGKTTAAAVAALFALFLAFFLLGMMACSTTSDTTTTPTTGILIRSETLTAGRGCGSEPSQLYKYVAVVYGFDGTGFERPVTSNIFDCYTDGAFLSLTPAPDGNSTFRLEVFAYNFEAYSASSATLDGTNIRSIANSPADLSDLRKGAKAPPTWTTVCYATQLTEAEALASCSPLGLGLNGLGTTLGPTTITLATTTFHLPDGRTAACANVATDGGVEAGADAGEDAGADDGGADASDADVIDAGTADAGDAGALRFANVRVRTRVGADIVADTIVACPTVYSVDVPATPPTSYDLDVGLLDSANNLIDSAAILACAAASTPGASSSAICPSK